MRNTRRISSACILTPFHLVYRGLHSSRRMIRMIRMIWFGRFGAIDELRLFDTGTGVVFWIHASPVSYGYYGSVSSIRRKTEDLWKGILERYPILDVD